ncbi:acetyl esterase [Jatrophihabitans endophyticus]|uniref:Acetyl esterase n=1 Tax=Jatrophihabitans endophyticus TaxID=1206085 RepID=A0A1M5TUK8_9ACTN|nr:alpha/beta hydrolase [Jatrophihabitans endophyticus]SHH54462.1 acetyl esterase [Jatrophihabitans endophyticus]
MPLDPQIAGLLQMMEAAGNPPISQGTPDQARAGLRTLMVDLRDPASLVPVASVTPGTIGDGIPVRVYRPEADGRATRPTVVYFHGGGFVIGDLDTHENVCRRLCRDTGAVVVSVDYPLAPEQPFPAALDTSYAALRWVADHVDDYGDDEDRLVVGGDSAGGNLAAVCAQLAHRDGIALAAQLLVYPAVDMLGDYSSRTENGAGYFLTLDDMHWFAAQYLASAGPDDERAAALAADPRVSPLLADSLAGIAPAVVATAEFDPLRDEGDRYAEALTAAGVPVRARRFPGLIHGFYGMETFSSGADAATTWINGQLGELLAGTSTDSR